MENYVRTSSCIVWYMGPVLVKGRMNSNGKYLQLQIFTVHFVIAIYLEHAIFNPFQLTKLPENKSDK